MNPTLTIAAIALAVALGPLAAHAQDNGHFYLTPDKNDPHLLSKQLPEPKASCPDLLKIGGLVSTAVVHCEGFYPIYADLFEKPKEKQCLAKLGGKEATRLLIIGTYTFKLGAMAHGLKAECRNMKGVFHKAKEPDGPISPRPCYYAKCKKDEKKAALDYCRDNPDARETGKDDESAFSVEECADRITKQR